MCLVVIPKNTLDRLVAAAQNMQSLADDGTLASAYIGGNTGAQERTIDAMDKLTGCAAAAMAEHKEVSPFLRYRNEVLDNNSTAKALRRLVLNLWNGWEGLNLSRLFWDADPWHRRIALEMLASYSQKGENDPAFMALAGDIRAKFKEELEVPA